MPPKPSRKRQWQTMLNRRIRELVELAREIEPEAEVQMPEPFEGEDAVSELRVAPEKSYEAMLERSTQIWWDDGFEIVVLVREKKLEAVKGE